MRPFMTYDDLTIDIISIPSAKNGTLTYFSEPVITEREKECRMMSR